MLPGIVVTTMRPLTLAALGCPPGPVSGVSVHVGCGWPSSKDVKKSIGAWVSSTGVAALAAPVPVVAVVAATARGPAGADCGPPASAATAAGAAARAGPQTDDKHRPP